MCRLLSVLLVEFCTIYDSSFLQLFYTFLLTRLILKREVYGTTPIQADYLLTACIAFMSRWKPSCTLDADSEMGTMTATSCS